MWWSDQLIQIHTCLSQFMLLTRFILFHCSSAPGHMSNWHKNFIPPSLPPPLPPPAKPDKSSTNALVYCGGNQIESLVFYPSPTCMVITLCWSCRSLISWFNFLFSATRPSLTAAKISSAA